MSIPFKTHFFRVEAAPDGLEDPPQLEAATTNQQLFEYRETHKLGDAFNNAALKYDDAFFNDKALILIFITEKSGSISHTVHVKYHGQVLHIDVTRLIPEGFVTMDMARWLAVIELESTYVKNHISLKII